MGDYFIDVYKDWVTIAIESVDDVCTYDYGHDMEFPDYYNLPLLF